MPSSSSIIQSHTNTTNNFRLLPELDDMNKKISDLELEQTRLEAARAREARQEEALRAIARAEAAAESSHQESLKTGDHSHKTPEEIEGERLAALRCAATAGDAFNASYEASWSSKQLKELLDKEERMTRETADLSAEARRFAHFAELGAIASPVARAAIYHLWDVDAMNQPCRCASCGVVLLLKKQYVGDKLVEVFCAKCTAEHHRNQLYRDNLDLQEYYLKKTFDRIDEKYIEEAKEMMESEEPKERRLVQVEQELEWQLLFEERFKTENVKEWKKVRNEVRSRQATGIGVL